jgi:hypothetical protein
MMRSLAAISAMALLALGSLTLSGCGSSSTATPTAAPTAVPKGPISVTVLSVTTPHTITKKHQAITVHVRIRGLALDPTHIGRKPVARHGHMQIYLDRIPQSAYTKGDLSTVLAVAAGPTFTFLLSPQWRIKARGHHRYLIALAQNNEILYARVKPASFTLTVK